MQRERTSMRPSAAPPRRKACEDCSKSKRRCDLDMPACSRCSKLGLDCHYHVPPRKAVGGARVSAVDDMEAASVCLPQLDGDALDDSLQYDESLDLPFMDEALKSGPMAHPMSLLSSSEVMSIADPVSTDLFNPDGSRMHYMIETFKSSPARMVHENATPWCHSLLYKDHMPKSMHDAYAACAMYLAKNDVNKLMVFRAIERNAAELKVSPQSTLPIEILARTQALLMYQIIRLFDGDIRLRAVGEASMSELEASSYQLLSLLNGHGMWIDAPESSSSPYLNSDPPSHSTWIFQESCRRTLLIGLFFISFYAMIREGSCIHGMIAEARSWTFGAPLWDARSEFDFKVAWRKEKHFIIQNFDFGEVLLNASPGKVDDLGKSFLVMSQGVDEVKEWYYNQGFKFEG